MTEPMKKGREAYVQMSAACDAVVESGNWRRVGSSDIQLFLNMYVQALLLAMAQTSGRISADLRSFIAQVPSRDVLSIGQADENTALSIGFKNRSFAEGMPLLLRCCVAMDEKDGTNSAQKFVDGVSALLYAAAQADQDKTGRQLRFITTYIGSLRTFLLSRAAGKHTSSMQQEFGGKDVQMETAKDNPPEDSQTQEEETLEQLLEELDTLIGLENVKREVRTLINLIKVRKMREQHGMKIMDMSFHMVFTGNPGTGKTTIARLIAKIYRKLGFLSKGQLVETDRSGLVAGYVGQTAGKVTEVVKSALGGILFIDEAYSLSRGAENDFGGEAIDTLVKLMEDNRDDLVVIVAGYTEEMHDFLTSNPGLISRFNKYIDFPDYTDDELMDILAMNAKRQGYVVSQGANGVVRQMLEAMSLSDRMDFGNARGMRNTLEKLVQEQANRLASETGEITREMLEEITEEDARTAFEMHKEENAKKDGESEKKNEEAAKCEDA